MSEFKIPNGYGDEITFMSGVEFIDVDVQVNELDNEIKYFELSIEQAKELILFLQEKIAVAESKIPNELLKDTFEYYLKNSPDIVGCKKENDLYYTFLYKHIPCAGLVTHIIDKTTLQIMPVQIKDDIGNGFGAAIYKHFNRRN